MSKLPVNCCGALFAACMLLGLCRGEDKQEASDLP